MKKVNFLLMFFSAVLLSCVDNSTTFPDEADGVFYGTLSVGDYSERAGISVTETSDSTVDIFFNDVKFAWAMPLRVDIIVKEVPCLKTGDILSFAAVDIDPYMNREIEPQPEYRFSTISGVVDGNELVLAARMADNLKPSRAGKEFSFKGTRTVK